MLAVATRTRRKTTNHVEPRHVEPRHVALWTTWAADPNGRVHRHRAVFDDLGRGRTTLVSGHTHRVFELDVLASSDHAHQLTATRAPLPEEE